MIQTKERQMIPESTHWYKADGSAFNEIEKKEGGMRPVNIRDAKKFGLFPSVTGINKEKDNPILHKWKENNIVLTYSQMLLDTYHPSGPLVLPAPDAVLKAASETAAIAARRGEEMHKWIEKFFCGESIQEADDASKRAIEQTLVLS